MRLPTIGCLLFGVGYKFSINHRQIKHERLFDERGSIITHQNIFGNAGCAEIFHEQAAIGPHVPGIAVAQTIKQGDGLFCQGGVFDYAGSNVAGKWASLI